MASKAKAREKELDLHGAIECQRVDEVTQLLSAGVAPNALADQSRNFKAVFTALCTAISSAAYTISEDRAKIAEANQVISPDSAPADLRAERAASMEILRALLASGADPNRRTLSRTPLSLASSLGDVEVVELLLDAGANPSGECWSPLSSLPKPKNDLAFHSNAIHEATEKGFTEVVKLLCERGADPFAKDHEGKTALQIAKEHDRADIIHCLEQYGHSSIEG